MLKKKLESSDINSLIYYYNVGMAKQTIKDDLRGEEPFLLVYKGQEFKIEDAENDFDLFFNKTKEEILSDYQDFLDRLEKNRKENGEKIREERARKIKTTPQKNAVVYCDAAVDIQSFYGLNAIELFQEFGITPTEIRPSKQAVADKTLVYIEGDSRVFKISSDVSRFEGISQINFKLEEVKNGKK